MNDQYFSQLNRMVDATIRVCPGFIEGERYDAAYKALEAGRIEDARKELELYVQEVGEEIERQRGILTRTEKAAREVLGGFDTLTQPEVNSERGQI